MGLVSSNSIRGCYIQWEVKVLVLQYILTKKFPTVLNTLAQNPDMTSTEYFRNHSKGPQTKVNRKTKIHEIFKIYFRIKACVDTVHTYLVITTLGFLQYLYKISVNFRYDWRNLKFIVHFELQCLWLRLGFLQHLCCVR